MGLAFISLSSIGYADEVMDVDATINNSYLSCKLARDLRRKDLVKSLSAFEFYTLNKAALAELDDSYSVDGLTVIKVKQFCQRVERDLDRGRALAVYDKASKACRDSRTALNDGKIAVAKQHYEDYQASLSESEAISSGATQLERGSLQWRQCKALEQDIASFDSGKLKAARDRLDKAYARCLPIWSEFSTQNVSSLTANQISLELAAMQQAKQTLNPLVKQLNVPTLTASLQEFNTCIAKVEQGLPQQYVRQRLVALRSVAKRCELEVLDSSALADARQLIQERLPEKAAVTEEQAKALLTAEQALEACIDTQQEKLNQPQEPLLLLDQELEQEGLDANVSVLDELLAEE